MNLIPIKIMSRLTLGVVAILMVTSTSIYTVMVLSGEPKLIQSNTKSAEQSAMAIAHQLSIKLGELQARVASMASLGATLPTDVDIVKATLPPIIDSEGDVAFAGGGLWPEPGAFTPGVGRRGFYWPRTEQGALVYTVPLLPNSQLRPKL